MPIRMLRPWVSSDKMKTVSVYAERFFVRLIMVADDYGCFYGDPALLKSNLFPYLTDSIRVADLTRWLTECQEAGLIVLYENSGKRYVQILDFRQRLDKARSKFPLPQQVNKEPELVNDFPAETETENETEKEEERKVTPIGDGGAKAPPTVVNSYENVEKTKLGIYQFLKSRPAELQAYFDFWNIFAEEKGLSKIQKWNDTRKRKLTVRIRDKNFDFTAVLKRAAKSEFLLKGRWFGFDWIIENETNYLKVIEGNYESTTIKQDEQPAGISAEKLQEEKSRAILSAGRDVRKGSAAGS